MAIQGGRIQKSNKKSLNAKGKVKGRALKRNCPAYLVELIKKKKKVGAASSSDRGGEYISQEFKDYLKACGIVQQLTPPYTPQLSGVSERRNRTLLDMGCEALVKRDKPDKLQQRSIKCIFIGYPKETMEISGRAEELEEIQDEDTSPSKNTSNIPMKVEGFEPPQEEVVPVRRSTRTNQALDHLCLNVEVEEYSLRDPNEPANYKATILDPESDKWLNAMNAEMQSMKDIQVWRLVDLPPNSELRVYCYCDARFETDRDDIKSQIGYIFVLNGGTVDWKSSKQNTTAMSTT
ncbi:retrotransposon protein, putative, ty1-copia subclass [Tanacetum coccineum]|uniref:Retrotransposon protein, putative, ty1-copia subclass n=1 Tax=Tanacetum coccineum TaxID=301880 RepID=A0ABQ4YJS9_9ASTR